MVPMLTMLGRFSEWIRWLMLGAAVVTPVIMTRDVVSARSGLRTFGHIGLTRPGWVKPLSRI
jgi:hypothetical protein